MDAVYLEDLLIYQDDIIIPDATIEINPVFTFLLDIRTTKGIGRLVDHFLTPYQGKIMEIEKGRYTRDRDSFENVSGRKLYIDTPEHPTNHQMFLLLTDSLYEDAKTYYHVNQLQLQDRLVICYDFADRDTVSETSSSHQLFGFSILHEPHSEYHGNVLR